MLVRRAALAALAGLLLLAAAASAAAPAPAFTLKTFDGKTISLGDLRGKVVALIFWAPW